MIVVDALYTKSRIFQQFHSLEKTFCAPTQLDGGLNSGFIRTDDGKDVCGRGQEKNEVLKKEQVSNQKRVEKPKLTSETSGA